MIIAIDGPAGAGKSTVARELAQALGGTYLDTGAMYRAVARAVLDRGLDPGSEETCARVARELELSFDAGGRIRIDGSPGEPGIRAEEVTAAVSRVSAHARVREAIVERQRALAAASSVLVAEGRDMGTVVFPEAAHKFFLIATPKERARRRAAELGAPERQDEIQRRIEERDRLDSERAVSPLAQAPDALCVDTEGLSAGEVTARLLDLVRRNGKAS
jgi:cytidylate kinase